MTATVSVVTDRRNDVLAVPNAALRFRPEGAPPARAPRRARRRPGRRRRSGSDGAGQLARESDGDPTARAAAPAVVKRTVYVLVDGERRVPREVTTGITDGRVTEITGGELKEGENVIVRRRRPESQGQRGQGQRGGGFRIL